MKLLKTIIAFIPDFKPKKGLNQKQLINELGKYLKSHPANNVTFLHAKYAYIAAQVNAELKLTNELTGFLTPELVAEHIANPLLHHPTIARVVSLYDQVQTELNSIFNP